jgi:hypothetical protein
MPNDFAVQEGTTYPETGVPSPLPTPLAATTLVAAPDVLGAGARLPHIGHALIAKAGLTSQDDGPTQMTDVSGELLDGFIVGQNPAAGPMVQSGPVTLHIGDYHPHPAFIAHLGHRPPTRESEQGLMPFGTMSNVGEVDGGG